MTIAPERTTPGAGPRVPLMIAARDVASAQTMRLPLPGTGPDLPPVSGDPVEALAERVRPATAHAVDPLQVAARLEADGLTDRAARVEYGFDDVFAVAEVVFRRVAPGPPPAVPPPPAPSAWRSGRRDIAHGLLYLMPSALFPAVLAAVGRGPMVAALVLTGGLGWAWSGGASWLAYRRLGAGDPAGAARALGRSVLLGLPAAALLGAGVVAADAGWGSTPAGGAGPAGGFGLAGGVGLGLVALCVAQSGYQLASLLLVFYRREGLLAGSMTPAVLAGCGYVLIGGPGAAGWTVGSWTVGSWTVGSWTVGSWTVAGWTVGGWTVGGWTVGQHAAIREWTMPVALVTGALSVLAALLFGLREVARAGKTGGGKAGAGRAGDKKTAGRAGDKKAAGKAGAGARAGLRTDLPGLAWATGYAALSAAYLLHAQARYLAGRVDIAFAAVPLLAGMGVVEWRARRFVEQARAVLARVSYPRQFAWRIWSLLACGVVVSTGVVAVLALPLLGALSGAGLLGRAGVLMAAAHAVLAGAYFLSFLLAGQGRYPALCTAVLLAGAVHVVGGELLGAGADPLIDTGLFLASAVLLQLLWAALLVRAAAQPWRHR